MEGMEVYMEQAKPNYNELPLLYGGMEDMEGSLNILYKK